MAEMTEGLTEKLLSAPEAEAEKTLSSAGFSDGRGALRNLRLLAGTPLGKDTGALAASALASPSPDDALNNLESLASALGEERMQELGAKDGGLERLAFVCGSSPYLVGIMRRNPEYAAELFARGGLDESRSLEDLTRGVGEEAAGAGDEEALMRSLRVFRQKEILRIGTRDLLQKATLEETTRELSDLASSCLEAAVGFAVRETKKRYGQPVFTGEDDLEREAEFTVLGLGKLGGRELNFSSDIDLIYIYSSDKGETTGVEGKPSSKVSLHNFFVKVSRLVTRLMSTPTEDGLVFRVDLDLRPEGTGGPMANSLRSAEIYYESWGQTWERAAMIKARPVAGSKTLGSAFLETIRPFVFRRYLDFTTLEEIRSMKEKINRSLLRSAPDVVDVKLGAGGIREIEFFCQALQLVHGGKDPDTRERSTLKTLQRLGEKGLASDSDVETLTGAYVFLRDLEHRIQIVEGRQSQAVPAREAELTRLARMMGFRASGGQEPGELFWEEYKRKTSDVHEIFRTLFYREEEEPLKGVPKEVLLALSPDTPGEEATGYLRDMGFRGPEGAYSHLESLKKGGAAMVSPRARVLLEKLAPLLLQCASGSPDPDRALAHTDEFLCSVGARTSFYSLLWENPRVAEELMRLFGTSEFISRTLIEHPENLDLLLSDELAVAYKKKEELAGEFASAVVEAEADFEDKLDEMRRLRNQEVFRVAVNDITGELTHHQVSVQMTFLAEAALEASIALASDELAPRYGRPGGARLAILGLGKLGGRELSYGSDLDIVFVYEDAGEEVTSGGSKDISTHEYFVKLCQRIISVLSVRTREGVVFNVDTRLRPSGSSGPLVVTKRAMLDYHAGRTQVWERQAMTRARAVAGSPELGGTVLRELEPLVFRGPLSGEDVSELLRIRRRMEEEIAKETSSRYNIKTGRGGLVDIEFLTQTLQLHHGKSRQGLMTPYTLKALSRLSGEGILSREDYEALRDAYLFYRHLELRLRVVHDRPEGHLSEGTEELTTLAKRAGYSGTEAGEKLLNDYRVCAEKVRGIYKKYMEALKRGGPGGE